MSRSAQDDIKKDRPPSVLIDYKVDENGVQASKSLPLVTGVLADLSGTRDPDKQLKPLAEREFADVGSLTDGFDGLFKQTNPYLRFTVPNRLARDDAKDEQMPVELRFKSMADFTPAELAKQVAPLRALLEARTKLQELRAMLDGKRDLQKAIEAALSTVKASNV